MEASVGPASFRLAGIGVGRDSATARKRIRRILERRSDGSLPAGLELLAQAVGILCSTASGSSGRPSCFSFSFTACC